MAKSEKCSIELQPENDVSTEEQELAIYVSDMLGSLRRITKAQCFSRMEMLLIAAQREADFISGLLEKPDPDDGDR
jgi:hypothetical protein